MAYREGTSLKQELLSLVDKETGVLTRNDIEVVFATKDLTVSEQERILTLFNSDKDGHITCSEFKEMIDKLHCESTEQLLQRMYLYTIFDHINSDGNTILDHNELMSFFTANNLALTDSELSLLIAVVDENNDGNIDFDEFCNSFQDIVSMDHLVQKSRLRMIFNRIDTDSGGALEFDEIRSLFHSQHIKVDDDTLKRLISSIDHDESGTITFDEFESVFESVQSMSELVETWSSLGGIDVGTDLAFTASLSTDVEPTEDGNGVLYRFPFLPFIAGGSGGICSRTATAPLERIKILAQTGGSTNSMRKTLEAIIRSEGTKGLWKGNLLNVLRVFPFGGIVCFTYGQLMQQMEALELKFDDKRSSALRFGAGCIAGGIATTITYPLDLIRTQITASIGDGVNGQNVMSYPKALRSWDGIKGLYTGLWPTLFAMSAFVGVQQSSYDFMRLYATSPDHLAMKPSVNVFVGCSICAGVVSQTVVYPLDVVRRRMQMKDQIVMETVKGSKSSRNNIMGHRTWFALRNVVQLSGFRTLFAGIIPTYLKVIPSVAISVTIRDILLGRLED